MAAMLIIPAVIVLYIVAQFVIDPDDPTGY